MAQLRDRGQFVRFTLVQGLGTVLDYAVAVALVGLLTAPQLAASTAGFLLGTVVNYCAHNIFSYAHTSRASISLKGYGSYLLAVLFALAVRLAAVALLGAVTALPFWLILIAAIGASFVTSYVLATLWVFARKSG